MGRGWAPLISAAAAAACAGTEPFPDDVTWHVTVTRSDSHPTYACDGTVDTRLNAANFLCVAEQLGPWTVSGPVERSRVAATLRLWIRAAGSESAIQPDIAVDLEAIADRLKGWGTVVLPDGTGAGHPGAVAEAWVQPGT